MTIAGAPVTEAAPQDISAIATGEWPDREFPLGPREKPTRRCVIFKQSVLNDIRTHGRSAPDIEVCGVLVGNVYHDTMGPFVFIEANIRGNFSAGKNAQVTFTAETWTHIQDVMDRQFPDLRILGWYHTHPGHGIFLSDMDLFIHKNFFSLPWHLAFVFDPQHLEEGLFAWRTGNMVVESFVVQKDVAADTMRVARRVPEQPPAPIMGPGVVGDFPPAIGVMPPPASATLAPQLHQSGQPEPHQSAAHQVHIPSGAQNPAAQMEMKDLTSRLSQLEKRQRWTNAALALLVLLAVGWPIALAALAFMHGGSMPWQSSEPAAPPAPRNQHPSRQHRLLPGRQTKKRQPTRRPRPNKLQRQAKTFPHIMDENKITISWDDLRTRKVEQRVSAMQAMRRNREYAQITDAAPEQPKRLKNLWYNAAVYMSLFGLLGGLAAWGCGTALHFKNSDLADASDAKKRIEEVRVAAAAGKMTAEEKHPP